MLTIIGTGHVFKIGDSVAFIVKHLWPDAVCVELDDLRYHALIGDREAVKKGLEARGIESDGTPKGHMKNAPPVYRKNARYQERMSREHGSQPGADMLAAVTAGKALDAHIFCIDKDAQQVMAKMWNEMGTMERLRYRFSQISDKIGGKRKVGKTQKDYSKDEAAYVEDFRRKYPTLVRVLIDERNEYMAAKIREVMETHSNVIVVVGDGHVDGLLKLIPQESEKRVIRLRELSDPDQLNRIKTEIWEGGDE